MKIHNIRRTYQKQIRISICGILCLLTIAVLFLLLRLHYTGTVFPTATDRQVEYFSQDVLYQELKDFELLEYGVIRATTDDPCIVVHTNPNFSGNILEIYISDLSILQTHAQIFFAYPDESFNEENSVWTTLENGLNVVELPSYGFELLRLDLAVQQGISMIVHQAVLTNYTIPPDSDILPEYFWFIFMISALLLIVIIYFCFSRLVSIMPKKLAVTAFMLGIFALSTFLLSQNPQSVVLFEDFDTILPTQENGNSNSLDLSLSFSEEEHFHIGGITVEIIASNPDAGIFFTTDGSAPTVYSDEYVGPLYFGLKDALYTVALRAVAVYGESITEPLTHTYFIGEEIYERFGEDILVFSLSTNPEYLFDHDIGILVDGRLREEWIHNNPDEHLRWFSPANWNMLGREWERPINVETFTASGERVLNQEAGVRVHGERSRSFAQKSLRLIARRDYSPEAGRFQFDFFPDEFTIDGTPIISTNTLVLRNGGSTYHFCMLRNDLSSALARDAGFRFVTPSRPTAVFLNGEYYGFAWLNIRADEHYLQAITNAPAREFDIDEERFRVRSVGQFNHAPWRAEYLFYRSNLLDDAVLAELEALTDINDFLMYYAFQIFVGNEDWPNTNVRRWRYGGASSPDLASELDGRWRYFLTDLDRTFGVIYEEFDTFHRVVIGTYRFDVWRSLLSNLLARPDMADKFTMIMCDLAANIVNVYTVGNTVGRIFNDDVRKEIGHWAVLRNMSLNTIAYEHNKIMEFAANRQEYIFESLSEYFGFGMEMYTVKVTGGEAIIGTQHGTYSRYFNHLVVPVSPALPEFTEFCHWVLGGERIYYPDITVSLADANYDNVVELELVTRPFIPPLIILEAYTNNQSNGLVLINLTDETINTNGLYLSNNPSDLRGWRLPAVLVAPGETLELAGRGSRGPDDLFRLQMDFNVRNGRLFLLSDETGRVLDTFSIRTEDRAIRDLPGF